ncbi:MAG: hypothetical protein K2J67_06980 [Lachnospiraceae bacterium]|nr:hypothetical protein [Lachnospiraceae bacterium]
MTDVQERIMVLMDEINFICQKEKLRYVLINNTAVRAIKKHVFGDARYEFKLLMPMEDIARLQAYVETHYGDNRGIESWSNNSALYQMVFRYVDKDSLLIDGPAGRYFTMPGIAITIYPARRGRPADAVLGAERYLQQINNNVGGRWKNTCCFLKLRSRKVKQVKEAPQYCADHILSGRMRYVFGGRNKLAAWIMKHQNMQGAGEAAEYWYMKKDSNLVRLPENMFTDVEWVDLEGRQVCAPVLENAWVEKDPNERIGMSTAIRVICECDLPYEEYLAFLQDKPGPSWEQLMCHYREYANWMVRVYQPMEEKVSRTFLRVRRSVDRIDVWHALRNKRDAIREAFQQKDIAALEELLQIYLEKTDLYLKEKIGFYIDEELFQSARLVWESRGKMKYADRVYRLVPEIYKKESVEETLAQGQKQ